MAAMHDTSPPSAAPVPFKRKPSRKIMWFAAFVLCLLVAGAFIAGYLPKRRITEQLNAAAEKRRTDPPFVNSAKVKRAAKTSELLLPGNITPITEAYILHARPDTSSAGTWTSATGCVRISCWPKSTRRTWISSVPGKGCRCPGGKPARAGAGDTAAAHRYSRSCSHHLGGTRCLPRRGGIRQDGDMQSTAAKTAEANVAAGEKAVHAAEEFVRASKAELQRLVTLQGYERITAPFAGIITARNVDVGALISVTGSSQGPARPSGSAPSDVPSGGEIFRVAEIARLRILVSVPQMYLPSIQVGQAAKVSVQERPNLSFPGKVTRTSSSLDAASRTLLTEVQVDNPTGVLLPGMYALLQFIAQWADPPFLVPGAALVTRANGTMLAVLEPLTGEDAALAQMGGRTSAELAGLRRIHFVAVKPGRDYGTVLEILQGLRGDEEVVVDPGDAVKEGALVQTLASDTARQTQNTKPGNK